MSINKTEFVTALREVSLEEFNNIPKNEKDIDFSFSEGFELKMEKLIHSQRKTYWNFVNTASKKAAIICMAIVVCLSCMLSVKSIRVSAFEFIENIITKGKSIFQTAY